MTATTLFGIYLAPLYAAIAKVESDNGKNSPNVYQLTRVYVSDCNRICGGHYDDATMMWHGGKYDFQDLDRFRARWISERMMYVFWEYYGKIAQRDGRIVTPEFLANIHRYGYMGACGYADRKSESEYWKKVGRIYDKEKKH